MSQVCPLPVGYGELALNEDTAVYWRNGRIMNANLADYHVPVNADIGEFDVPGIDTPHRKLDSLGCAWHR